MAERDVDGASVDVRIDLRWDDYNTSLFVEKLFRHVRRGELRFDLEARESSIETTFAVVVSPEMTVTVIEGIARYLHERVSRAEQDLQYPDVVVFVDGAERRTTLRGPDDVRGIVEHAHVKVRDEDQRDLDDFSR